MSQTASRDRQSAAAVSLAELFRRTEDFESFRSAVLKLEGGFPFMSADMIELGKAYFERFPDRDQERNADEVRLGYAVVWAAIIEKAVPPSRRKAYRALFNDVKEIAPAVEALIRSAASHRRPQAINQVTNSRFSLDPKESFLPGTDEFLTKPVDLDELLTKVARALK